MPLSTIFKLYNVLWQSVLLVEETGVPGENLRPAAKSLTNLSCNVVSSTTRLSGIQTHNFVVIGTDCIGSCKSNCHKITTTMAPYRHSDHVYDLKNYLLWPNFSSAIWIKLSLFHELSPLLLEIWWLLAIRQTKQLIRPWYFRWRSRWWHI